MKSEISSAKWACDGGCPGTLEEVHLPLAGGEPDDREAEDRRRQRLEPELLDVEATRHVEVVGDDADVVEARAHSAHGRDVAGEVGGASAARRSPAR